MGKRIAVSPANLVACPCANSRGKRTGKATGHTLDVEPCPCHFPARVLV